MSKKIEKNKAEKILNKITWWWVILWLIIGGTWLCVRLLHGDILVQKMGMIEYQIMLIMFLITTALIPLSLVLAAIAAFRKAPKIRARIWLWVMIKNISIVVVCTLLLIIWLTSLPNGVIAYYNLCPPGTYRHCATCAMCYGGGEPESPSNCSCVDYNPFEMDDKPVIYLYPQETTDVFVQLGRPDNLTHTYPPYNDGWQVTAQPDGDLTDDKTGRHYYSLYWEGVHTEPLTAKDGFIVAGPDTVKFLEEKLAWLGLSEREAQEFIIYWLPKLESNPYNFIRFQTREEIDANMPLTITPQPDTLIRVMMTFRAAEPNEQVPAQILPPIQFRDGFVAVEWGGTEL